MGTCLACNDDDSKRPSKVSQKYKDPAGNKDNLNGRVSLVKEQNGHYQESVALKEEENEDTLNQSEKLKKELPISCDPSPFLPPTKTFEQTLEEMVAEGRIVLDEELKNLSQFTFVDIKTPFDLKVYIRDVVASDDNKLKVPIQLFTFKVPYPMEFWARMCENFKEQRAMDSKLDLFDLVKIVKQTSEFEKLAIFHKAFKRVFIVDSRDVVYVQKLTREKSNKIVSISKSVEHEDYPPNTNKRVRANLILGATIYEEMENEKGEKYTQVTIYNYTNPKISMTGTFANNQSAKLFKEKIENQLKRAKEILENSCEKLDEINSPENPQ